MGTRGIFERGGVWWISYCDSDGARHREKVGRRAAALDAVSRRRTEIKDGRYIPPKKGARLTFRELASAAMVQKKLRLAPLSYITDQLRLKKLLPLIGAVPVDLLGPDRIEDCLGKLAAVVSSSTVNRYRSLIQSIFAFAVRAGTIAINPVSKVKRYKERESRVRWLKPDEEKKLRAEVDTNTHEAELNLALHTGMRRGEQFRLEWKNVDLENAILTVSGKTGQRHIVANKKAIDALEVLKKRTGKQRFVSPGANFKAGRDWSRWFEKAIKRAGVLDFKWHDLRHTFASRLVMRGVDIRTIQELLGHKSIVMTMKYSHLAQDHRQSAAEKMVEP